MAVLTGLAPDPYRPGYRLLEVDRGRFACLAGEAVASLPLAVGEPIAPAVMARLHALADAESALRAAMRMLALRSHARAELRRRANRWGCASTPRGRWNFGPGAPPSNWIVPGVPWRVGQ